MSEIQINPKYHNQIDLERVNRLIQEAISFYDPGDCNIVSGDNIQKLDEISFVLMDNLEQMTNFREKFFLYKLSYDFGKRGMGTAVKTLLEDLKNSKKEMTFLNLIEMANNYLSLKKDRLKETKYTFYIPTRLEFGLNRQEQNKLKKYIKKCFGINIIKKLPSKIKNQFNKHALISLFENRQIIFEIKSKSRDIQFSLDNYVNPNVNAFLGAITFSQHYGRYSHRFGAITDYSITSSILEPEDMFIIEDTGKVVYPLNFQAQHLELKISQERTISMIGKLIWNVHNIPITGRFDMLLKLLQLLSNQKKEIQEVSKDLLNIYFEASIEKQLIMSFFKFWILTERIVKISGSATDEKVVSIIRKLTQTKYTKDRISNLYKKRNSLVHTYDGKRIISEDRDLIRNLSENLLLFFFDPRIKFNSLSEFGYILDNIFLDKKEIELKESILRRLKNKKFPKK